MNTVGFKVVPADIPNEGILYVDHEANGRSGHGGNTMAECLNGDLISFYSNVSGEIFRGHGVAGWSEYKRSKDGGKTWSQPYIMDYSKRMWEENECYSALIVSVVTAPNGTLVAIAARFETEKWVKQLPPVYLLSYDHGETWTEPRPLDEKATVEQVSITYDTSFVYKDSVYIVFIGGAGDMCPGPHSLYVSQDHGESFMKRSDLPFHHLNMYSSAAITDDGRLIVYSYPWRGRGEPVDEHNLEYVVSEDEGYTWSEVKTAYFAKKLRNPQLSEKIGDYYFIHGRSGSRGENSGHLVLYSSKDAVHWDEGVYLNIGDEKDADSYSANLVVGKNAPSVQPRLLIQSSIAYDGARKVNERHWWIEDIVSSKGFG